MDDAAFADLMAELEAELADPRSRSHRADDLLGRVKEWHPQAIQRWATTLQLEALGVNQQPHRV